MLKYSRITVLTDGSHCVLRVSLAMDIEYRMLSLNSKRVFILKNNVFLSTKPLQLFSSYICAMFRKLAGPKI